jgi:KDO2-lipid IV(A) lauroyltransferase
VLLSFYACPSTHQIALGRTATFSSHYGEVQPAQVSGFTNAAVARTAPAEALAPPTAAGPAAYRSTPKSSVAQRLARRAASGWLKAMFFASRRFPSVLRSCRGFISRSVFLFSRHVRNATLANAARILGPDSTPAQRKKLAIGVIENFYLFCVDVGRSLNMSPDELYGEIAEIVGRENYDATMDSPIGPIIVTAHMGSFEVGLAGLWHDGGRRMNVIFRRDAQGGFERQRTTLRQRLGVKENPIDDGWTMWVHLRDALAAGESVIFQGDRVMPTQRGRKLPFLHGHLEVPTGPVKLARISGAPLLPVFTVREPSGKITLYIEPPIRLNELPDDPNSTVDPALLKLTQAMEKYIRAYPEQWLMFHPAFCEDRLVPSAGAGAQGPIRG